MTTYQINLSNGRQIRFPAPSLDCARQDAEMIAPGRVVDVKVAVGEMPLNGRWT